MFLIEYHYPKSDVNCEGDYWEVRLISDGKMIKGYGDYYHDKGSEKISAFIEGINYVTGNKPVVETTHIADLED
jgi:hypothetical protein